MKQLSDSDILKAQLFQAIAEEAMFGIVAFDPAGDCLFINAIAQRMLGSDVPSLASLSPQEPEMKQKLRPFSPEIVKFDGLYQDVMVKNSMAGSFISNIGVRNIQLGQITASVLTFQDVTMQKKLQREIMVKQSEIKHAHEELLKQNSRLQELDHAKNRFIALTTHELRTPLSAMVASAEVLKMGLYDNPEQMKEFIDIIYDQGQHLQDLVNDILDFAKIQAGKMDYFIELQDPVGLVSSLFRNYEDMAKGSQIQTKFEAPSTPVKCYFDDMRLRQVLSNVMSNAIKYNRAGGQVTVSVVDEEKVIKVLVKDTGKGIPRDQWEKVFDEFETIGQVALHHNGTGLGMPISRRLMNGMGGQLLLDSEVGVGSTFWVEIPKEKVLEDQSFYRQRPDKMDPIAA